MNSFLITENLSTNYEYIKCEDPLADTILFVHGLGLDMSTWDEVVDLIKADFNILRYDLREHGKSVVKKREPFTWELLIQDLELLLKGFSIQKFHFVGHSGGGNFGLELAMRTDYIKTMTLFSTGVYFPLELGQKEWERRQSLKNSKQIDDITLPIVNSLCYPTTDEKINRFLNIYRQISVESYLDYANLLANTILSYSLEDLQKITIPIMLLVGEFDVLCPPKLQMISMNYLSNCRYLVIPNSANAIMVDQPEELGNHIKSFIIGFSEKSKVKSYSYTESLNKELKTIVDSGVKNNGQTNPKQVSMAEPEDPYQKEIIKLISSVQSLRHDFSNHIQVVHGLLKLEKADKALEYLSSLFKEIHSIEPIKYDKSNPGLFVLLQTKKLVAENHNIDIHFDISNDAFNSISTMDIIKILSNLIDNAIDATTELPEDERKIKIVCKADSTHYLFKISNTGLKIKNVDQVFKSGYSTKKPKKGELRGQGLFIVKEVVNKYGGEISIVSSDIITVTITIPL
jgi:pimeloyl-ACP methyl ester carboxylesterase